MGASRFPSKVVLPYFKIENKHNKKKSPQVIPNVILVDLFSSFKLKIIFTPVFRCGRGNVPFPQIIVFSIIHKYINIVVKAL